MQPYFFPYIGYWQLINAVDVFVIYDNIKFTKKGWIHRNRILVNGEDSLFSLPLKNDSDFLDVKERSLASTWSNERGKLLRRIAGAYQKAPFFKETMQVIEKCLCFDSENLFEFIFHSIKIVMEYLGLEKKIIVSSAINMNHELKGQNRVIETCKKLNADVYINPTGGKTLYNPMEFANEGIVLRFMSASKCTYRQFNEVFVPNLSIIDVLMFNKVQNIWRYLEDYDLERE